ncbi:uncharacterized protein [Paramormyrops kingsleyae]|uniref:uncharacterized protein n=1 Tax=Paramormyrops kingsleyae TaxID=1676925 RepID=UPI003B96DD70
MIRLYVILAYFSELCFASDVVFQSSPFLTVEAGEDVTLECSFPKESTEKQPIHRIVEQYPVSDTVQPGDSVTLQCTIETESCAGEHSVYWFRHGSGESLPGVIYSHGNRSDECEKSPEAGSPTRSCVYSLPKRNLSLSDAGTYYCAVAMCGEMLFGNGTKIHIEDSCHAHMNILIWLSIIRMIALLFVLLTLSLIYCTLKDPRVNSS